MAKLGKTYQDVLYIMRRGGGGGGGGVACMLGVGGEGGGRNGVAVVRWGGGVACVLGVGGRGGKEWSCCSKVSQVFQNETVHDKMVNISLCWCGNISAG